MIFESLGKTLVIMVETMLAADAPYQCFRESSNAFLGPIAMCVIAPRTLEEGATTPGAGHGDARVAGSADRHSLLHAQVPLHHRDLHHASEHAHRPHGKGD